MDPRKSILGANYNNVITTPRTLGAIRGEGKYFTGNGMSSNWQQGQQPTFTQEFPKDNFKNQIYDLSNKAPVGQRINNKWSFTEDQANAPLKGDPYQQTGLNFLHETPTALNMLFFDSKNVKYLSRRIIEDVYRITGVKIKPQDENSLMVYMTNAYVLGHEGWMPATSSVVHLGVAEQRGPKECSIKNRLTRLNQTVLQQAVKDVLGGMSMYMTYYKDASSMPIPLDLPTYASSKGANVLQQNIGLYSGNSEGISSFNQRYNIIN